MNPLKVLCLGLICLGLVALSPLLAQEEKQAKVLEGHTKPITSVVFSKDGVLASASDDQKIKLWDVATGKELATLQGHTKAVYSVAFSPDGKTLASGGFPGEVKLWTITTDKETGKATGKEIGKLRGKYMAFSPDGKTLASGYWDTELDLGPDFKTIQLSEVPTGKVTAIWTDKFHAFVYSVAFSPDGKTLASGRSGGGFRLWDVKTGTVAATYKLAGAVRQVAFSPDGKNLAVAHFAGSRVSLWDMTLGNNDAKQTFVLQHGRASGDTYIAFSPDSNTIATAANKSQEVKLWDVATGKETHTLKRNEIVTSVAFSPDGKTLALGCADNTIHLVDVPATKNVDK